VFVIESDQFREVRLIRKEGMKEGRKDGWMDGWTDRQTDR